MRVGARAGAKAADRGRIARFRALSTRGGSFPHGARASDSGRRTTVERGTRSDPEAIGDHIPWREQPAEQQRACRGQPETIEPGACTSRNSSTPIAIKAAIAAITGRGRREVAIATSKKTIVPHAPSRHISRRTPAAQARIGARPSRKQQRRAKASPRDRQTPSRFPASTDRGALLRHGKASATGIVSSNAVPCSESSSRIAPPWASSMARTMARPIPVPPLSRRVVKKLSNICAAVIGRDALAIVGDLYPQQISFAPGGYIQPSSCHGAWHCRRDWKR